MATLASELGVKHRAGGVAQAARLQSIDALRGLVMVIMLLDHVRETFFMHMQVTDPMDARVVMPALFFTRLSSAVCAPAFVALTGLSAWLYGRKHSLAETSAFLLKRGVFLIFLEFTFVGFAWTAKFPPETIWLQVIWAIGISMVALSLIIRLPRGGILTVGLAIVCLHNLLDGIVLQPGDRFYIPWAILHQRALFELGGISFKTTYPVFPWIGVIALGYVIGPWFALDVEPTERRRRLLLLGGGLIAFFVLLRFANVYGDRPWFVVEGNSLRTAMSFVALTKYPPSLLFLSSTLGIGAILLAVLEGRHGRVSEWLGILGGAPMFFYLLHLYVLQILYSSAYAIWGSNHGRVYGFEGIEAIWLCYLILIVPLYFPTRWFSRLKRRRRDIRILSYL